METSLPVAERPRRPEWMKVRAPSADSRYFDVKKLIHGASLNTVCEEARCPNIAECWGRGTATFQILGDTCTRACRYCYVTSGKPEHAPDPLEPLRLAQAAAQMGLRHVVVTSVDRDDVRRPRRRPLRRDDPRAARQAAGGDGRGADAGLPRRRGGGARDRARRAAGGLQPQHRDRAPAAPADARREGDYDRALWLLARAKEVADYPVLTKSGIIVGLGETNDEVVETLRDLRAARRRRRHDRPVPAAVRRSTRRSTAGCIPDEFRWLREQGEALGFGSVFAGPLVRSTYRADEQRRAAETGRGAVAY